MSPQRRHTVRCIVLMILSAASMTAGCLIGSIVGWDLLSVPVDAGKRRRLPALFTIPALIIGGALVLISAAAALRAPVKEPKHVGSGSRTDD